MTSGELLPEHSVLRHIRWGLIENDGDINPRAFQRRASEPALSTTWVQYWADRSRDDQILLAAYHTSLRKREGELMAEVAIGRAQENLEPIGFDAKFLHDPTFDEWGNPENPAHVSVTGLPSDSDDESEEAAMALIDAIADRHVIGGTAAPARQ